jgi:hypothetical protein
MSTVSQHASIYIPVRPHSSPNLSLYGGRNGLAACASCRPRRNLHGHSACEAYHPQPHARFNKRARLAVFD